MPRILSQPGHAFRVQAVRELGLLVDAADYYRAFYQAALGAERYLLLSGWQFDSDVALLRGEEAERAGTPVELLGFLNHLCIAKPALRVWILAWDFHLVFAAEREWMQDAVFEWTTNQNLQFRFDSNHVERGCHHQKFVVVDGEIAFLGGLDLCDDRWDDRQHRQRNALRLSDGEPHKPFHDVQAFVRSRELSASLVELFAERWIGAGGEPVTIETAPARAPASFPTPEGLLPLAAERAALSRTDPHGAPGGPRLCKEIEQLHCAAIASATHIIYAETQYLTARVIGDALIARMQKAEASRLEIVVILNMRGETLKEQVAVGLAQAQLIDRLRQIAKATGHALGIYYTLPACDDGEQPEQATYIHSKLMIVDDRLLTVGSANLTNRSMAVDTELNLSVESEREGDALSGSIRAIRGALLAEHTGGPPLTGVEGLVRELDALAAAGAAGERIETCRLRIHPSPTAAERTALAVVDPQKLPFDPSQVEELEEDDKLSFVRTLKKSARELFASRKDRG